MNKKYNTYDEIKAGDVVVFLDGTSKTVEHCVDGHHVIFSGETISEDLWVIQDEIDYVYLNEKAPSHEEHIDENSIIDATQPNKDNFVSLATSYSELNRLLMKCSHQNNIEFYHYTEVNNLVSILECGFLYSRSKAIKIIKFDNTKYIDMSNQMVSTNRSNKLNKNVRFYLNPKNQVTYSFNKCYENNNTFGVLIALDFSAIWKSNSNVLLMPINAHHLYDSYFDWSLYNIKFSKNLANYDANEFNFQETYKQYDPDNRNNYTLAEILFSDCIDANLISKMYFKSNKQRDDFLSKLDIRKQAYIIGKCEVRPDLLW